MKENFDKFIEEKLASDNEFQASLENLADDEKTNLITAKKLKFHEMTYKML